MKLVWSPVALSRVEEIVEYIGRDRPGASRDWVAGLFQNVSTLAMFPRKGRVVREVGRTDIREIIYERHRVIYKLEATRVAVLTVRHERGILGVTRLLGAARARRLQVAIEPLQNPPVHVERVGA